MLNCSHTDRNPSQQVNSRTNYRPKARQKIQWFLSSLIGMICIVPSVQATTNRLETFLFDIKQNRIVFVTDSEVEPRGQIITNPTRLVIDLPGASFQGPTVRRNIGSAVQSVRVGQPEPDMTRMVIEFAPEFQIDPSQLRLKSISPNRWFLQLPNSVAKSTLNQTSAYAWPTTGEISAGFGWRIHPITGQRQLHKGIDIAAPMGAPIIAAADGVISFAKWDDGGYGNLVEITHPNGSRTLYAHTNKILVSEGQQVRQGQVIAEVGSTGRSTGPHLHFEVQVDSGKTAVDPIAYLPQQYILFDVAAK